MRMLLVLLVALRQGRAGLWAEAAIENFPEVCLDFDCFFQLGCSRSLLPSYAVLFSFVGGTPARNEVLAAL